MQPLTTILARRTDVPRGRMRDPHALIPGMRGEMRSHQELAELLEPQHGVVTFRQLRELGFSKGHISRAYEARRLHRIHRGVYAVGHARISNHARSLAAVLACGSGAVLSHHSAAWLWGFHTTCPAEAAVTVPSQGHRRRGVRVYRVAALSSTDHGSIDGIPVTAAARTLLDLGAVATARDLARAVDRAKRRGHLDLDVLDAMLRRRGHTVAGKRLAKTLELYRRPVFDRARSELLFLEAIEGVGLTPPALNRWTEKWEIDAYWEAERFAVEVDGWETHGSRQAFEDDRLRVEEMKLAGIDVIRISARRIEREPERVALRLRTLLARRRVELGLSSQSSRGAPRSSIAWVRRRPPAPARGLSAASRGTGAGTSCARRAASLLPAASPRGRSWRRSGPLLLGRCPSPSCRGC